MRTPSAIGFSFDQYILAAQHFEHVTGRVPGRQYYSVGFQRIAGCQSYALDLVKLNQQFGYFSIKYHFAAGI